MRLEPRFVWSLRQYGRRGDRQRNRWRHETQGEANYWRKRTGVHCTGSTIRGECTTGHGSRAARSSTCTAQFARIDPGFQVQRPAAIRGVPSLRSPHFAGFSQNSVHTPTTGDRFPVGESGLGRNRALRASLTDTGYCPGNGRRPTRLRPWCGRWVATRWQGGLPSETRTLAIRLYTGCGRSRHRA